MATVVKATGYGKRSAHRTLAPPKVLIFLVDLFVGSGCWCFVLTSVSETHIQLSSATPVGSAIYRFHASRSPTDAQDAKPQFYLIPHSGIKSHHTTPQLFDLDSDSGVLSVSQRLEDHITGSRNKGQSFFC